MLHFFLPILNLNEKGNMEMRINKQKTKIEFIDATNHIYLTVGKSTKLR